MAIDLVPELLVGDYRLLQEAGAGGFSVVWRAEHLEGEGTFALKFPKVERFLEHLRQEADLAAVVEDSQVVPIVAAHLAHDPPYLVMPWIEGRAVEAPSELQPRDILAGLEVVNDLAGVLERLHARGVAHGDVKPGNLRVDAEGRVRLLDLGLARLQVETNLERSLAQSLVSVDGRSLAGTLDYMAPELFEGSPPGPASDVYALGILLHELVTGRAPAFGVSPREVNPDLPLGSEDLLRDMLRQDPETRLTDLGRIRSVLEGLIRGERACLARRNGHLRRRVWIRRVGVLRQGARALLIAVAGVGCLWAAVQLAQRGALVGLGDVSGVVATALFILIPLGLLLGMTTINAWVLGVPEGLYKNRPGHPLWTFMMQ